MADRLPRRSRRLRGLSPMSAEPSSRRHRSNSVGDFYLVVSNKTKSDPLSRLVVSVCGSSTCDIVERSTPLISRVLFSAEEVKVE